MLGVVEPLHDLDVTIEQHRQAGGQLAR